MKRDFACEIYSKMLTLYAVQNANKKPKQDILIDSLNDLSLKQATPEFLLSLPKIRPVGADGECVARLLGGCSTDAYVFGPG
jgi:hypothetical protein